MWALTALLAVGTVMNAASSSRWERFGWAPLVLGLTVVSCNWLAPTTPTRRRSAWWSRWSADPVQATRPAGRTIAGG
jgi:hypothetical protein